MQKTALYNEAQHADIKDYLMLLKPGVMSLVVFTGLIGLTLAPLHIHPFLAFLVVLSIALGCGAAAALNMWYERDIDALMKRTENRPLPQGRMEPDNALSLGILLSFFSIILLGLASNWFAASILALAILFYVFVYTIWLKRKTPQNIVIGGAAGAFPPVIGWVAVQNQLDFLPVVLFLIIFFWTPPHFWSLALYKSEDYTKAGIPMLPVVGGIQKTKTQILIYALILFALTAVPVAFYEFGWIYGLTACTLNSIWFVLLMKLYYARVTDLEKYGVKSFFFSLVYLFILFISMMLDRFVGMVMHGS
jgi:heme o synthase